MLFFPFFDQPRLTQLWWWTLILGGYSAKTSA